ncbi:MAG: Gldg family protein [Candidatus Eiseniibacteriota bacterium]
MISRATSFRVGLTLGAVLLVGIAIFLNRTVSNLGIGRFDLTEDKIYSISPGAKRILADLTVPVQIKYYVTPENEMPAFLKTLQRDVTDKLNELSIASKGRLEYQVVNPKETPELEEALIAKGVRPFQAQSLERDAMAVKLVYSGVAIGYKDEAEDLIPQLLPDNLGSFEYDLLSRIVKLVRDADPVVAIYSAKEPLDPQMVQFYIQSGQDLPPPTDNFRPIPEFLRGEGYDVRPVELTQDSTVPEEAKTLLLLGPRDLNDRQRYEISGVLRRGGSVIVAAQATVYDYTPGSRGGFTIAVRPQQLGVNDLISQFGVRIEDRILMDTQMATLAIPRESTFLGMRVQTSEPVQVPTQIRVLGDQLDRDLPFNAGVPELLYLWGNRLVVDDAGIQEKGLEVTTLFTGGDVTWTVEKAGGGLVEEDLSPDGHPLLQRPPLAVLVEGVFPDPWADAAAPDWPVSPSDTAAAPAVEAAPGALPPPAPGRLVVIGCSKMFEEMLINQAGHALFLINMIDAVTLGEDLISIRSKQFDQRTFGEVTDGKKLAFRVINIALVPALVAAFGLGNRIRRRREADEYAAQFARAGGEAS